MTNRLRPEARPATWEYLDQTQRRAFKDIVRMLDEAVIDLSSSTVSKTATKDCTAWVSANRSSRTVFLSGGRGTGKTTLLLSLVNATRKGLPLPEKEPNDNEQDVKDVKDVKECLERIRSSIIWLEPIDMEPMPSDANLLAAILVRIDEAVRCFGGRRGFAETDEYLPRNLLGSPDYQEALLELQRLQTDSSLAWSGNLPAREGALDPDSFAVEVFRSERARLGLNHRLEQTLNTLAQQAFRCTDRAPLFVLPVDDIDLNPLACLDLLKLLRLVSVPRLFTLLLGDVRVADLVLNLKLSSDLGSLVNNVRYPELLALRPETIGAFAGDIAANALRKLLPPSQRVELLPMTLDEGINFLPLGERNVNLRLHQLLAKIPVLASTALTLRLPDSPPLQNKTLLDFLLVKSHSFSTHQSTKPPESSKSAAERDLFDVSGISYTGSHLFESTPRRLADLWLEMQRLGAQYGEQKKSSGEKKAQEETAPGWKDAVDYFARLSLTSLTGEPILSPEERTNITNSIAPNPKMRSGWDLGRLPLDVYDQVEVYPAMNAASVISAEAALRIYLSESKDWYMQARSSKESPAHNETDQTLAMGSATVPQLPGGQSPRLIQRSTLAELVTFHDLWMLGPDGNRRVSPFLPEFPVVGFGWAHTEWSQKQHSVALPWLAPRFQSFWEFDLFHSAWNQFVRSPVLFNVEMSLARGFFTWVSAGTAVIDGHPMVNLFTSTSPQFPKPEEWDQLTKRLEFLTGVTQNSTSRRSELAGDWLVRVAAMLMPETGLRIEFDGVTRGLPEMLMTKSQTLLQSFWQQQNRQIIDLRALRLAELVRKDLDGLAEKLRETPLAFDPNHNFKPEKEIVYKMARKEMPALEPTPSASSLNPSSEATPAPTEPDSHREKPLKPAKRKTKKARYS